MNIPIHVRRILILVAPALLLVTALASAPAAGPEGSGHSHATAAPSASEAKSTTKVKPATLQGEIVDPQCWIQHDGRGKAHTGCALACSKAGQTLAFLDDKTGTLYQVLAANHSADPNEPLYAWVGKPVIVKGDLMARGGMNAIVIKSVVADRGTKQRP